MPRSFPIFTFIYRQKIEQNYFLLSSTFWQIYLASGIDRRIQLAWHIRHFIIYSHTSHLCIGKTYIYYNYQIPFVHIYIYIYIIRWFLCYTISIPLAIVLSFRNDRNNVINMHCLCHWNISTEILTECWSLNCHVWCDILWLLIMMHYWNILLIKIKRCSSTNDLIKINIPYLTHPETTIILDKMGNSKKRKTVCSKKYCNNMSMFCRLLYNHVSIGNKMGIKKKFVLFYGDVFIYVRRI